MTVISQLQASLLFYKQSSQNKNITNPKGGVCVRTFVCTRLCVGPCVGVPLCVAERVGSGYCQREASSVKQRGQQHQAMPHFIPESQTQQRQANRTKNKTIWKCWTLEPGLSGHFLSFRFKSSRLTISGQLFTWEVI